ncbi:MAG: hypothetical protein CRN43_20140, partial [Candidatus Nephrothrix sp. EaCA]
MILSDEKYIFKPAAKNKLLLLLGIGAAFAILGLYISMNGGHEHGEHTASLGGHGEHGGGHEEHHGSPLW